MSTLTSAQLHVKRSSTRRHAPPGGVSSLSFGSGGFGTAEPAEEVPSKEDPGYARPSSGRYPPSTSNNNNNNNNAPGGGYPSYSQQLDPAPYNNYAPPQQMYQQQQSYQYQAPYNPSQSGHNYGGNSFSGPGYATTNSGYQAGRPPSSTPSSRSSARSSLSSSSWGSQPPLTSSKRDQNWEKKRRSWLARKNSGSSYGDCPTTSSSTWSHSGPVGGALDDTMNPPSPLSKFMHQQAQQQQQPPPPTPHVDYQRVDTASSSRSSNYMHESYPTQQQLPNPGFPARASLSRAGLSTASSTVSTSRRQPPGGQCQWSLG